MGGEDGGDVDMTLAAQGDTHPGEPFVEVSDDSSVALMGHELKKKSKRVVGQ
jgi:hypothetical protein